MRQVKWKCQWQSVNHGHRGPLNTVSGDVWPVPFGYTGPRFDRSREQTEPGTAPGWSTTPGYGSGPGPGKAGSCQAWRQGIVYNVHGGKPARKPIVCPVVVTWGQVDQTALVVSVQGTTTTTTTTTTTGLHDFVGDRKEDHEPSSKTPINPSLTVHMDRGGLILVLPDPPKLLAPDISSLALSFEESLPMVLFLFLALYLGRAAHTCTRKDIPASYRTPFFDRLIDTTEQTKPGPLLELLVHVLAWARVLTPLAPDFEAGPWLHVAFSFSAADHAVSRSDGLSAEMSGDRSRGVPLLYQLRYLSAHRALEQFVAMRHELDNSRRGQPEGLGVFRLRLVDHLYHVPGESAR
ncbi:hypothetical protein N7510_007328 [Penicillium lagena]|uniref:uncharacterized protein n=1 Tax=Penicillium lagena TaxID=94218 RepID=UPI0025410711|nr:uncharacterized protein N7510_007328 [Penicillium lagena]KAJ5610609.1 hypothetical protein N7510_007328 [Penicillium lagena]